MSPARRFSSKNFLKHVEQCPRFAVTSASRQATSRRWATRCSSGVRSPGPISTKAGPSWSFPRISRGSIGRILPTPSASGSGRTRRIPGEKSSALSETNATMASTSRRTAIVYWPMLIKEWWNTDRVSRTMTYVVRSDRVGSPGFLRELQQAVWSVNPNLPLASVRTLDEIQADSIAQTSFALVMLAIAAAWRCSSAAWGSMA